MKLPDDIKELFRKAGAKGGKSKSPAKREAILANLKKARDAKRTNEASR